jgi:diguanylate cyclase (GGDEF)-like protein
VTAALAPKSLVQIIAKHRWSSLRDAVVLSGIMVFAVLVAGHYDIFAFLAALADPRRMITPAEAVVLAALFVGCVYTFISRRIYEERCDEAYHTRLVSEVSELRALAMQDPLTRLPNRRALLAALDTATTGCVCDERRHAFFLLDLNHFKDVNDSYGHAAGDDVLQVIVERFRRAARPTDVLARLGGDEFAVLSYDVDRRAAEAIGKRFIAALEHEMSCGGHRHRLGVAIGAALMPDDGTTTETLMRQADLAMYRAKKSAQSTVTFFDPKVDTLKVVHRSGE